MKNQGLFVCTVLLLACFMGCDQVGKPTNTPSAASSNNSNQPSQQQIVDSWSPVVDQLRKNCESYAAKEKADSSTVQSVTMSHDLKKSDSLLSPYVGVVTIIKSFNFSAIGYMQTDKYTIEYVFSNGKWVPKKCDLEERKTPTTSSGKQETSQRTYSEEVLNDPKRVPISRIINWHKIN